MVFYYCRSARRQTIVEQCPLPFCPALKTPEVGYLKPPVNGSEHRKQEFIDDCYRYTILTAEF
jgi:hypothetical protein